MISYEIKQSLIDIVHQETWKTASLTTATILAGGVFIIFLAKNWLLNWVQNKVSHEFNQKLEAYKSDLQKDVEAYKSRIQNEFEVFKLNTAQAQDRRTRSNEKEYDACIECWNALRDAYQKVMFPFRYMVAPLLFDKRGISGSREFLKKINFNEEEIKKIFSSDNKEKEFSRLLYNKSINESQFEIDKMFLAIEANGIFISKDLHDRLFSFGMLLKDSVFERTLLFDFPNQEHKTPNINTLIQDGDLKLNSIMQILRENLYIRAVDFTNPSQRDALKRSPAPQPSPSDNSPEPEPTAPK